MQVRFAGSPPRVEPTLVHPAIINPIRPPHRATCRLIHAFANDPHRLALMKFAIGQPVVRTEDPILVRGAGRYTDDVRLEGKPMRSLCAVALPMAVIKRIDTSAARGMAGVLGAIPAPTLPNTALSNASCRSTTATERP